MSDHRIAVYDSIANVQAELSRIGISKTRKNQQQGYAYRGIDDVYAVLAPLLSANKLCILPRVVDREATERTSAKGGVLFYCAVTVEFDLVSAIDGSMHTVSCFGEAFDSGDKSIGKALSYAYKSMAFMLFAIPLEGQDNDTDAHSHSIKVDVITETQANDLLTLIEDVNADVSKFCVFYKINAITELPTSKFNQAVKALEAKRSK